MTLFLPDARRSKLNRRVGTFRAESTRAARASNGGNDPRIQRIAPARGHASGGNDGRVQRFNVNRGGGDQRVQRFNIPNRQVILQAVNGRRR